MEECVASLLHFFTFHFFPRPVLFKHERGAVEAPRSVECVKRVCLVLCRSGNDLLSRVLRHSTIGAEEFNGRVRDGIGFGLLAQITGPAKNKIFVGKQWVKEGRARS